MIPIRVVMFEVAGATSYLTCVVFAGYAAASRASRVFGGERRAAAKGTGLAFSRAAPKLDML